MFRFNTQLCIHFIPEKSAGKGEFPNLKKQTTRKWLRWNEVSPSLVPAWPGQIPSALVLNSEAELFDRISDSEQILSSIVFYTGLNFGECVSDSKPASVQNSEISENLSIDCELLPLEGGCCRWGSAFLNPDSTH